MFFLLKACCTLVASLGNCPPAHSSLNIHPTHSVGCRDLWGAGKAPWLLEGSHQACAQCQQRRLPAAREPVLDANQESSLGEVNEHVLGAEWHGLVGKVVMGWGWTEWTLRSLQPQWFYDSYDRCGYVSLQKPFQNRRNINITQFNHCFHVPYFTLSCCKLSL